MSSRMREALFTSVTAKDGDVVKLLKKAQEPLALIMDRHAEAILKLKPRVRT